MAKACIGLLFVVIATAGFAQDLANTPRAAAVRFARANGLEIPSQDAVVAIETRFGNLHGTKESLTRLELERDATEIARLIGPSVPIVNAAAVLRCRQSQCAPEKNTSVLVVNEAEVSAAGSGGVFLALYSPSPCQTEYCAVMSMVVVDVERKAGGWIGVGNRHGPTKVGQRVPK